MLVSTERTIEEVFGLPAAGRQKIPQHVSIWVLTGRLRMSRARAKTVEEYASCS